MFVVESYNGICRYELFEKERHILLTCLLSVVIPLLVMGVLYGLMATEARKQVPSCTRIIPGGATYQQKESRNRKRRPMPQMAIVKQQCSTLCTFEFVDDRG